MLPDAEKVSKHQLMSSDPRGASPRLQTRLGKLMFPGRDYTVSLEPPSLNSSTAISAPMPLTSWK